MAIEAAPTEQQNRGIGREVILATVSDIRSILQEYEEAGGNTGKISGRLKKFVEGTIFSTEAPLREIEQRINAAVTAYTNAVSGAQFGEKERENYESLFPSIKLRSQVNFANLNALERDVLTSQEAFYRGRMGTSNYDALFGEVTTQPTGFDIQGLSDKELHEMILNLEGKQLPSVPTPVSPQTLMPTENLVLAREFEEIIGSELQPSID